MSRFEASGTTIVRAAIADVIGQAARVDYATARWGLGSNVARYLRGAVEAEGTGNAPQLVVQSRAEFVDAVSAIAVLDRLEGLRNVPANIPVVKIGTGATAFWVGEGNAIPVSRHAFERSALAPLSIGAIVVMSKKLLASTDPAAEAVIRRDLIRAAASLTDLALLDPTNAGQAGVMPASITYGATSIASSGNIETDLSAAVAAFAGDFSSAVWVTDPTTSAQIALSVNQRGLGDMGLRGGNLLGLPAYVSASSPVGSNGGVLVLLDAARLLVIDDRSITIRTSEKGTVEMEGATPTGATLVPTAASKQVVSLFQTDSVGFKMVREINWEAVQGAVVLITGTAALGAKAA